MELQLEGVVPAITCIAQGWRGRHEEDGHCLDRGAGQRRCISLLLPVVRFVTSCNLATYKVHCHLHLRRSSSIFDESEPGTNNVVLGIIAPRKAVAIVCILLVLSLMVMLLRFFGSGLGHGGK